jgi:hypothetical protein
MAQIAAATKVSLESSAEWDLASSPTTKSTSATRSPPRPSADFLSTRYLNTLPVVRPRRFAMLTRWLRTSSGLFSKGIIARKVTNVVSPYSGAVLAFCAAAICHPSQFVVVYGPYGYPQSGRMSWPATEAPRGGEVFAVSRPGLWLSYRRPRWSTTFLRGTSLIVQHDSWGWGSATRTRFT